MPIYRGTDFYLPFQFQRRFDSTPINVTSWDIKANFRVNPDAADPVLSTSLSNGQWSIPDGVNGKVAFRLSEAETASLPLGAIVGDVLRISGATRIRLMELRLFVLDPITRD